MLADPRSFSQLTTSFFGSQCQGIRPALFLAWPSLIVSFFRIMLDFSYVWRINCSILLPLQLSLFVRSFKYLFSSLHLLLLYSVFKVPFNSDKKSEFGGHNVDKSTCFQVSDLHYTVVGTSGLEPPTSRLSGVRSNHLSYAPIPLASAVPSSHTLWWRWGGSNSWPPACKAGALPAELHPH